MPRLCKKALTYLQSEEYAYPAGGQTRKGRAFFPDGKIRLNKWIGLKVKANHPRGGHVIGVVLKAEHEEGRGLVLTLSTGQSIVDSDVVKTIDPPKAFYVSTYCNFAHSMKNGAPIKHECRHIPTAALRLEREGFFDEAIKIMIATGAPRMAPP